MSCESILRAWLDDLLAEVAIVDDPKAKRRLPEESELPVAEDARAEELPEDIAQAMDTLRLCVKYMVFDKEASRRQNERLCQIIEQGHRRHGGT